MAAFDPLRTFVHAPMMRRMTMLLDRRTLLTAVSVLPLAACTIARMSPQPHRLRLATFNIWHDMGNWAARQRLLVDTLRVVDADVIALQEVLEDASKNLPNQAETLARALGGYSVYFFSTDPPGASRRYGNAILTRLPVIDEATRKLEPLDDYRTALRVRVQAFGRPIDLVVTHLAWQEDAGAVRARQLSDLLSWVKPTGVSLVVMGDFNAPKSDPGLAPLASPRFQSAELGDSVSTTLNPAKGHPNRIIDHIFVERERLSIADAHLIGDQPTNGEYPSDHFGVAATLSLR
jgi:endonuclease/exonuclease/phosphatase family metal-dependent hydrolase